MGFITLKDVKERQSQKKNEYEDRVKADWVKVAPDSFIKITPLQELDEDSPNYSEEMGKAKFALEHSHPDDFKKKAQCTSDDGECYGCSQGWYQKTVLYLNVLVDDGKNKPFPAVWSRGVGKNSVAKQLLEIAGDEDFGYSITDKSFKLNREGSGNDSSYTLIQLPKPLVKDVTEYKDAIFPLEKVVFYVAPERQEAYYNGENAKSDAPEKESVGAGAVQDKDW